MHTALQLWDKTSSKQLLKIKHHVSTFIEDILLSYLNHELLHCKFIENFPLYSSQSAKKVVVEQFIDFETLYVSH